MSKLTSPNKDFAKWYQEVVLLAGLADYSDIKGCMIIKPYGYALWENIQKILDQKIKDLDVANVYLPLFIPESYFQKEAEHVKGFAPQVAWVTEAGNKKLEERLAIRPTSETIMYRTFAKWISSYRDLPLKVNQWANVVRWEMRTRLFLRTTEFLWQEGHTLHQTKKEATAMVDAALKMYQDFSENYLAVAVLDGFKSAAEKFAGAEYTKAIEGMMRDGKALQMGTSHLLNQNFAKSFEIKFLNKTGQENYPWSTSWGVSTRLIGGLIMAHGDAQGLILPPAIAPIQVVIIPICKNQSERKTIIDYVAQLKSELKNIKFQVDWDDTKTPGWKFSEWELKGVPVRIEVGPKDVTAGSVITVRRDTGVKDQVALTEIKTTIKKLLKEIQANLLTQSKNFLSKNTHEYTNYSKYKTNIANKNFFALVPWCESATCEEKIKNDTKATIRVLADKKDSAACLVCGKKTTTWVYLAKAY